MKQWRNLPRYKNNEIFVNMNPGVFTGCHCFGSTKGFFGDTTFREGGAYFGMQLFFGFLNFLWDPKKLSLGSEKLIWGYNKLIWGYNKLVWRYNKLIWGYNKLFWLNKNFLGDTEALFAGYKKKMFQKHHENYNKTKLSFFKNVVFQKEQKKKKKKSKIFLFCFYVFL